MSTNVGEMNAKLTLANWEFNNGLAASETAAIKFGSTVEMQAAKASASMSKAGGSMATRIAQPMQQVGFAIQDFSSQFETRGLQGGLSAISNNIQMLGAGFGPWGLAISAVGGSLATLVIPRLMDAIWNTKELEKQAKKVEDAFKATGESIGRIAKIEVTGKTTDARKELEETNRVLDRTIAKETERLKAAQATRDRVKPLIPDQSQMTPFQWARWMSEPETPMATMFKDSEKQIKHIEQRLEELKDQAKIAKAELAAIGPGTVAEKSEEDRLKKEAAHDRDMKFMKDMQDGQREMNRLRSDGLEKYGTAQENMAAKHERELAEMASKLAAVQYSGTTDQRLRIAQEATRRGDKDARELMRQAMAPFDETLSKESAALFANAGKRLGVDSSVAQPDGATQANAERMRIAKDAVKRGDKNATELMRQALQPFYRDSYDKSMAALKAKQDVEMKEAQIDEQKKKLSEMGQAAKSSAGVLLNSSAGVSAIDRAVSGTRSEQDVQKRQVKVLEDQLKELKTIAKGASQQIKQVSLSG